MVGRIRCLPLAGRLFLRGGGVYTENERVPAPLRTHELASYDRQGFVEWESGEARRRALGQAARA